MRSTRFPSHALFAAEIRYFVRENMALSPVSAVVSGSWLLRAAAFQKTPFKMTFAGSNPPCPASQCGLSYSISSCARTDDIPAGYAGAPESLAGKFRTFGSALVAFRRQSPLAIFQFSFRYARDWFDMWRRPVCGAQGIWNPRPVRQRLLRIRSTLPGLASGRASCRHSYNGDVASAFADDGSVSKQKGLRCAEFSAFALA